MRTLALAALFVGIVQPALARPVNVVLDAHELLIKQSSTSVSIGLIYEDGTKQSEELFSENDLSSGITRKTISVDTSKNVSLCHYAWTTQQVGFPSPPGPVGPPVADPALVMPNSAIGRINGNCDFDPAESEIRLTYGDYVTTPVAVRVKKGTLETHSAKSVTYTLWAQGLLDRYFAERRTVLPKEIPSETVLYFLHRVPLEFLVTAAWALNAGGTKKDPTFRTKDLAIEIK